MWIKTLVQFVNFKTFLRTGLKTKIYFVFAAAEFQALQIVCVSPLRWKQILINHLHHGAATVTSKTGEEVMEKKRRIGPEIRFPTVFPFGKC